MSLLKPTLGQGLGVLPPAHFGTTAHLASLYPYMCEASLSASGVYVGQDVFGGAFVFDPFVLYEQEFITSTNVSIFGRLGRAKSSLPKSLIYRSAIFGRRAWVLDPKGEYLPLAAALGVPVIRLAPNGKVRINPLDASFARGRLKAHEIETQRLELLQALAQAGLARRLRPAERAALEIALGAAVGEALARVLAEGLPERQAQPTIPLVVRALLHPAAGAGEDVNMEDLELRLAGREAGLELRRLVTGDLRGMFDGQTSADIDPYADAVVVDLSAVYLSDALGLIMTCVAAWLSEALFVNPGGKKTIVVLDEAWAVLKNLYVARWLVASIKLSRKWGASWWIVTHKLSDFTAAGESGSEQVELAKAMFEDIETRITYSLPRGEVARSGEAMGLSRTEAAWLPKLPRGRALWKIGERNFLVQHRISAREAEIVRAEHAIHQTRYRDDEEEVPERLASEMAEVAPRT